MAGKFGSSAGEIIAEALVRARAEGTSRIGEEHLFAALLASPDSGPLLGRLGDPEQINWDCARSTGTRTNPDNRRRRPSRHRYFRLALSAHRGVPEGDPAVRVCPVSRKMANLTHLAGGGPTRRSTLKPRHHRLNGVPLATFVQSCYGSCPHSHICDCPSRSVLLLTVRHVPVWRVIGWP